MFYHIDLFYLNLGEGQRSTALVHRANVRARLTETEQKKATLSFLFATSCSLARSLTVGGASALANFESVCVCVCFLSVFEWLPPHTHTYTIETEKK